MRSYARSGIMQTGEKECIVLPNGYKADGTTRGILWTHGVGGSGMSFMTPTTNPNARALAHEIVDRTGMPIISHDFGDNPWGNDTHIARISTVKAAAETTWGFKTGGIIGIGSSMGIAGHLAWAHANPGQMKALVTLYGVFDLAAIQAGGGSNATSLNTAYGGTYVEATHGADHNGVTMAAAGDFKTFPIQTWYSSADTVTTPAREAAFAASVGGNVSRNLTGAQAHGDAVVAGVDADAVIAFLLAVA